MLKTNILEHFPKKYVRLNTRLRNPEATRKIEFNSRVNKCDVFDDGLVMGGGSFQLINPSARALKLLRSVAVICACVLHISSFTRA